MKDIMQFNTINFAKIIEAQGILSTKSNDPVLQYHDKQRIGIGSGWYTLNEFNEHWQLVED